jgi:hypothetical protein
VDCSRCTGCGCGRYGQRKLSGAAQFLTRAMASATDRIPSWVRPLLYSLGEVVSPFVLPSSSGRYVLFNLGLQSQGRWLVSASEDPAVEASSTAVVVVGGGSTLAIDCEINDCS